MVDEDTIQFCKHETEYVAQSSKAIKVRKLSDPPRVAWFPKKAIFVEEPSPGLAWVDICTTNEFGWHAWFSPQWSVE